MAVDCPQRADILLNTTWPYIRLGLMESGMTEHRFRLGQKVQFIRGYPYRSSADGLYEIVRQLPDSNGEFHYRIKSVEEPHERVVKESELEKA